MNRPRGRLSIRRPDPTLTPADLRRTLGPEVDQGGPFGMAADHLGDFSGGYRIGALVAGLIALSCAALAIAAQFLR